MVYGRHPEDVQLAATLKTGSSAFLAEPDPAELHCEGTKLYVYHPLHFKNLLPKSKHADDNGKRGVSPSAHLRVCCSGTLAASSCPAARTAGAP